MKNTIERIEWHDNDNATLHLTEEDEVRDDKGQVVGTTNKTWSIKTNREDLEAGLESIRITMGNLERKRETAQKQRERLGEPVKLTPEQEKLRRQLRKIGVYEEQQKYEQEGAQAEKDLEVQRGHYARRSANLLKRDVEGQ